MQAEIDRFFAETAATPLGKYHDALKQALTTHMREHGRAGEWDAVLERVPLSHNPPDFTADAVRIGDPAADYEPALRELLPWRKGPLQVGRTFIDTEWRSDWKWQRITPHLLPLQGCTVLDVGCGNGYHLLRMLGDGAAMALGVDPTILFNYQFALLQRLLPDNGAYLLPLRGEHLPAFELFDTVFSMGVLYHRRSPIDHLAELHSFLKPGGQLVLETLIVPGNDMTTLMPRDRYAKMGNVWFIPSTGLLEVMVQRAGFSDVQTVDVTVTTTGEQRATSWMEFQSLSDFLDPENPARTVEGYPAPTRAVVTARR